MSALRTTDALPANVEAEQRILGSILLDNERLFEATAVLSAEDFSLESHRRIFDRMLQMSDAGQPVDTVTLANELGRTNELVSIGGAAYLSSLCDGIVRRSTIKQFLDIVLQKSAYRQIIHATNSVAERAWEQQESPDQIIGEFQNQLLSIAAGAQAHDVVPIVAPCYETVDQLLTAADGQERTVVGYSTGIENLDESFGGFVPGELTYIGARPGVGKTSTVIQALCANGAQGVPCLFFSLEMTNSQILKRMFALVGEIEAIKLRKPWLLTEDDKQRIHKAKRQIASWPIHLYDRSGASPQQVMAKSKLFIRRHGMKVVFVDYFTRMRLDGKDFRLAANAASRILAQLAKDENVSVVCLSQLRRVENEEREPQLSDLKETASLEEDAHNVLLLHRPRRDGDYTGEDKIIVAKAREGALGAVRVAYDGSRLAFTPRWS